MNSKKILLCTSTLLAIILIQTAELRHGLQQNIGIQLNGSNIKAATSLPPLGFRNIFANYRFIQFLTYFGDEESRDSTGYGLSPFFFSHIIHYDPYFRDFYLFLSQSTSVYAGYPHKAVTIMEDGIKRLKPNHPSDGYHIWRYKGVDELLFLGDSQAAKESFEKSARWAAVSSDPISNAIGKASQRTAQFLAADPDSIQAQISAWASVVTSTPDRQTRERAVREIESLGGSVIFGENGSVRIESP